MEQEFKICEKCGRKFYKPPHTSKPYWHIQRYHSIACWLSKLNDEKGITNYDTVQQKFKCGFCGRIKTFGQFVKENEGEDLAILKRKWHRRMVNSIHHFCKRECLDKHNSKRYRGKQVVAGNIIRWWKPYGSLLSWRISEHYGGTEAVKTGGKWKYRSPHNYAVWKVVPQSVIKKLIPNWRGRKHKPESIEKMRESRKRYLEGRLLSNT